MNKKGFTLVELLGVLILLSIISIIAVTAISARLKESHINTCKAQEKNIIEAAKTYIIDHPDFLGGISVADLQGNGYLDEEFINPMTGSNYNNDSKVIVNYENSKYSYIFVPQGEDKCE